MTFDCIDHSIKPHRHIFDLLLDQKKNTSMHRTTFRFQPVSNLSLIPFLIPIRIHDLWSLNIISNVLESDKATNQTWNCLVSVFSFVEVFSMFLLYKYFEFFWECFLSASFLFVINLPKKLGNYWYYGEGNGDDKLSSNFSEGVSRLPCPPSPPCGKRWNCLRMRLPYFSIIYITISTIPSPSFLYVYPPFQWSW